jgi:enoyl-[acyl-carrier protein] reductase I
MRSTTNTVFDPQNLLARTLVRSGTQPPRCPSDGCLFSLVLRAKQHERVRGIRLASRNVAQMDTLFAEIAKKWGRLDILVHSIAFAPREALAGRVTDCPRDGFLTAMEVSCWSLLDLVRRAEPLMHSGGAIFAMSYHGVSEVIENYGIMGPVKAALASAVRYLAAELDPGLQCARDQPWPARDSRGFGIPDFDTLMVQS